MHGRLSVFLREIPVHFLFDIEAKVPCVEDPQLKIYCTEYTKTQIHAIHAIGNDWKRLETIGFNKNMNILTATVKRTDRSFFAFERPTGSMRTKEIPKKNMKPKRTLLNSTNFPSDRRKCARIIRLRSFELKQLS